MVNPDLSMLPPFLTKDAGLNSGMMIPQVTAAALVSENKTLCHAASADSIPTSANKEDHVSMGVWAAIKLRQVCANVRQVLEIELLCARYGIGHLAPLVPGPALKPAYDALCSAVPMLTTDRVTYVDFESVRGVVDAGGFSRMLESLE
jgi:histidine ammonia-lyase